MNYFNIFVLYIDRDWGIRGHRRYYKFYLDENPSKETCLKIASSLNDKNINWHIEQKHDIFIIEKAKVVQSIDYDEISLYLDKGIMN